MEQDDIAMRITGKPFNCIITGPSIADEGMKILSRDCHVVCAKPYLPPEEMVQLFHEIKPDALLVRMGKITKEVITASPNLKVIAKHGTGVDAIDIKTATRLKIPVLITPYANYEAVAEHVLGVMLAMAKDIPRLDGRIRQGHWDKPKYRGVELKNKTLGIIGFGRIGRRVLELTAPVGMKTIVFDPVIRSEDIPPDIIRAEYITDLLKEADIISIHCPLTNKTRHLIDGAALKLMKKSAWLINTARGGIVDEAALIDAVRKNHIAAAALDTYESEPPGRENPLLSLDRIILTPHIAGVTKESFARMGTAAASNIVTILKEELPDAETVVNPESLTN